VLADGNAHGGEWYGDDDLVFVSVLLSGTVRVQDITAVLECCESECTR
jgi:hypothetical protein